jgi:coenzyme F420-0:L-glutamate ligase / coenzyme F420-1:gamma-L-glutamate ligase
VTGVAQRIEIVAVTGLPEVVAGADLAALISSAVREMDLGVVAGDIFVVTSKIVSKAEGRAVDLGDVTPSAFATAWAGGRSRDERAVEMVLRESERIVRMDRDLIIAETRHGLVCANAGVDHSNAPAGHVLLLPTDPDGSAVALKTALSAAFGCDVGIIVSDTFGRPWREGFVNVAIGVAGVEALRDYRSRPDDSGRPLTATVIAVADEIASAAELVMGKTDRVPVALVRGIPGGARGGSARDLVRAAARDLFR